MKDKDQEHDQSHELECYLDWALFRQGPGRIEMNIAKTLLDYLWEPLGAQAAKTLGF